MKKKEPVIKKELAGKVLEKILEEREVLEKIAPPLKVDDRIKNKDLLSFANDYVLPETPTPETIYLEKNNLQNYTQEIMFLYDKIQEMAEKEGSEFKNIVGNIILQTDYWEPEHILAPLEEKRFPDIATLVRAVLLVGEDVYYQIMPIVDLPLVRYLKSDLVMCSGLNKIEAMLKGCQFADASTEVNRIITPGSPIEYGQPRFTQRYTPKTEE